MTHQLRTKKHYAEQRDVFIAPGHIFPMFWDELGLMWPDDQCFLISLTERQLNVVHSALSMSYYYKSFWGLPHKSTWDSNDTDLWDEIQAFLAEIEECLMSGCNVSDLIEAINSQTTAITDALAIVGVMGLDDIRDNLDTWRVQDGSDQTDRNLELESINAEMEIQSVLDTNRNDRLGDINTSTGIVADRIAPNGESVQETLSDIHHLLEMCCQGDDIHISGGISPPGYDDEEEYLDDKCKTANALWYWIDNALTEIILAIDTLFDDGIVAATVIIRSILETAAPGWIRGVFAISTGLTLALWATSSVIDLPNIKQLFDDNKQDIINAFYSAVSTAAAIDATLNILNSLTTVEKSIVGFFLSKNIVNTLFTFVTITDDITFWDCGGDFEGYGPVSQCVPPLAPEDAYLPLGSPTNIFHEDGSLIANTDTFSSEYDDAFWHVVNIHLIGEYFITVKNPSRILDIEIWDQCPTPNELCYESDTDADGTPKTYNGTIIILKSSAGSFTVDLDFNISPAPDYGC